MERPPSRRARNARRSAGRGKIDRLVIDEERVLKAAVPPGSRFKGYETYVVEAELILRASRDPLPP